MISTRSGRAKELDNIEAVLSKLHKKKIKEVMVRVDAKTVLFIREGKDADQAIENYKRRQLQSNNSFIY